MSPLNCSFSPHPWSAVHNDIVKFDVDATFHDRKGSGRLRKTTHTEGSSMRQRVITYYSPNKLDKELLQEIMCCSTFKRYSNTFMHCFKTSLQRIWTEVPHIVHVAVMEGRKEIVYLTTHSTHFLYGKKILNFTRRHRHWTLL